MKWQGIFGQATGTAAALLALSSVGCSRNHIKAIELANLGDQAVTVNVAGAIAKYEEATRLDPKNHRIYWKLANAYQKQEEWDKMATTLGRAAEAAPEWAEYHYRKGYAIMQLAEAGNKDAYEQAKAPLQSCIEKDANFAECYYWLGHANLFTKDEQGAIDNYNKAIEHDPTAAYYYAPLAATYIEFKFYDEAEAVLKEGTRIIPPTVQAKDHLYNMYTLLSQVYLGKGDDSQRLAALEKADSIAGDTHPENSFNLGSTYAVQGKKEKAIRLLKAFNKRACRSNEAAKKFKAQCAQSQALVQELGGGE